MSATPADIARYTQDGVALTFQNDDLKTAQPSAVDGGEILTFLRYRADALVLVNERARLLGGLGRMHEAIEVEEELGIGTRVAVTPAAPAFGVIDDTRNIDAIGRTRSTSFDMTIDRYSIELVG